MPNRTATFTLAACAALGALATANAGPAAAETHIRTYSGYGAERACDIDKLHTQVRPGQEVVLCDEVGGGVYKLTIVPTAEIPLHIARLAVTGSFSGLRRHPHHRERERGRGPRRRHRLPGPPARALL
ncbi:hypothetical protein ABZ319_36760, partial [Nocardia sp. NPDC005978]|uniref:hypothetical protein n=1 Tax=Nocardia sp. NPDC005978 TaxID=3156725 RepID=UPI00339E20CC